MGAPGNAGLDAIRDIVIRAHESTPVTVGDVASVEYGPAIRRGAQIASGAESVGGYVLKLLGSNTSQVLKDANQKLEQINGALPDGVRVKAFYSQKELIDKAVGTVESALLQGAVLVILILYLLLGNLRSTLIVVASLPLSALFAFIAMRYVGLSANLMSLGVGYRPGHDGGRFGGDPGKHLPAYGKSRRGECFHGQAGQ